MWLIRLQRTNIGATHFLYQNFITIIFLSYSIYLNHWYNSVFTITWCPGLPVKVLVPMYVLYSFNNLSEENLQCRNFNNNIYIGNWCNERTVRYVIFVPSPSMGDSRN